MPYISNALVPPAIARIGQKTYVVPDWLEVPNGTTRAEVVWNRPSVTANAAKAATVVKVTGSKGKVYSVTTHGNGKRTCDCPGYTYRRTCRHLTSVK